MSDLSNCGRLCPCKSMFEQKRVLWKRELNETGVEQEKERMSHQPGGREDVIESPMNRTEKICGVRPCMDTSSTYIKCSRPAGTSRRWIIRDINSLPGQTVVPSLKMCAQEKFMPKRWRGESSLMMKATECLSRVCMLAKICRMLK